MSEYQYYEFQAIDRPLTEREISELRRYSTRATITATRFVNHYEWGSFKGDPSAWMQKYFDAFLYVANWGTHELMLRLPRRVLDAATAKVYCCGESASAKSKGDFVILNFLSEDEQGDGWDDDGSGWLSGLIPLRAEIATGDYRALYLAWLANVQGQVLENRKIGPPVPTGLGKLTAAQKAFANFLRIDADLIAVAAADSSKVPRGVSRDAVERWVAGLPDVQKKHWLTRIALGKENHIRAELRCLVQQSRQQRVGAVKCRPVRELLAAAEARKEEQRRLNAERAAREKARRERFQALARERYLKNLAKREPAVWRQVRTLIAARRPDDYDQAVKLLVDLRALGIRQERANQIDAQIQRLCEEHAKKESFLVRLHRVGLPKRSGRTPND